MVEVVLRQSVFRTPFEVNVVDGRTISVIGRDYVLLAPSGRTLHIYQKDDSYDIVDTRLIIGISVRNPHSGDSHQ